MKAQSVPSPSPRDLLPPLLACLQSANVTRQPPPALLPLLSPILRQRVQLLSSESWLPLLCWDSQVASRLPQIIGKLHIEPHPVSGEVEVGEPDDILYRRLDEETLHARLVVSEFAILPTYLWCTGEQGTGWKLAELRGIQDAEDGTEWFGSLSEADEAIAGHHRHTAQTNGGNHLKATHLPSPPQEEEEDDDDDYWASYDRTPGRTPHKRSPAPVTNSSVQLPMRSEIEYFKRYASEVQPAMDAYDPDEDNTAQGESTLNGNMLNFDRQGPQTEPLESTNLGPTGYDSSLPPAYSSSSNEPNNEQHDDVQNEDKMDVVSTEQEDQFVALNHPRPSSSASSNSVERLEREAESHSQAEIAIKQHISTDLKSLFRLARSAGIDREEFERIVKRELEVLPLLERDE